MARSRSLVNGSVVEPPGPLRPRARVFVGADTAFAPERAGLPVALAALRGSRRADTRDDARQSRVSRTSGGEKMIGRPTAEGTRRSEQEASDEVEAIGNKANRPPAPPDPMPRRHATPVAIRPGGQADTHGNRTHQRNSHRPQAVQNAMEGKHPAPGSLRCGGDPPANSELRLPRRRRPRVESLRTQLAWADGAPTPSSAVAALARRGSRPGGAAVTGPVARRRSAGRDGSDSRSCLRLRTDVDVRGSQGSIARRGTRARPVPSPWMAGQGRVDDTPSR